MGMRVITSKAVPAYKPLDTSASEKIITCELQDKLKVTNQKTGDYIIEKEAVITSEINTQEYIDSFKNDVGIENILKKFALVNDPEIFNQVSRPTVPIAEDGKEVIQDYTNLPSSEEEAIKLAKKAKVEFGKLPSDLVKGRSFSEFAETCTKDELINYIQNLNKKGEQ